MIEKKYISLLFCLMLVCLVATERKSSQSKSYTSSNNGEKKSSINEAKISAYVKNLPEATYKSSCSSDEANCNVDDINPCLPMVYCFPFYEELLANNSFCKLGDNTYGARCRAPRVSGRPTSELKLTTRSKFERAKPGKDGHSNINEAMKQAHSIYQSIEDREKELKSLGHAVTNHHTPAFSYLRNTVGNKFTKERSKEAFLQEYATRNLRNSSSTPYTSSNCSKGTECGFEDLFYRRIDGACNNLKNPDWGRAFTAVRRVTPATYADGISSPPKSKYGKPLPSARRISTVISKDTDKPSPKFTLSVMQWGQFMVRDNGRSPPYSIDNSTGILCCDKSGLPLPASLSHPECLPIEIPKDDYFYSRFGQQCMNFVRSVTAPNLDCRLGHRNPINVLTAFLDGSSVYGSSKETANTLRSFQNGLLRTQPGNEFLPENPDTNITDFLSGDISPNETPHLIITHTLFVREHNRIARELLKLKPQWSDETIYQETRKIVAAEIQHITYNEFLSIVLGTDIAEEYNLLPRRSGFINRYDENLNPAILNEFNGAAFRMHTTVQGDLQLFGKNNYKDVETIELEDTFLREKIITDIERFDKLLRGLYKQPMQEFDNCVVDDLTNNLFKTEFSDFGIDLIATNIQRGRDYGMGTYNDLRAVCGLPIVESFYDLNKYLRPEVAPLFSSVYESVDDIDASIAGISEIPAHGGIVGETFNCFIREQLARSKYGDRFFYENGGMHSSFTEAQLNEIRKVSWSRIICDNSLNNIQYIQPNSFRLPDQYNVKVSCSSEAIPKMNLDAWYGEEKEV